MYQRLFKRFFDVVLSASALVILSPVLLIVAILVRIKLGSPVIFCQQRPGKSEKIFKMYKFRSMTNERDMNGDLLPDELRLTKFGKSLRATSLDELPELWNILNGDMSIVGPRPQLVRDMVFMTEEQRKRHTARPGLTGLAQINGRNCILWYDKLEYDLEYIERCSFLEDVRIVFQTVIKVLKAESVTLEGMATAEDFGDYLLRIGEISQSEYDARQSEARLLLGESPLTLAGVK